MTKKSRTQASALPALSGAASFVLSLILFLLPVFKLVSNSAWQTSIFGWALASVTIFIMYGLDNRIQNSPQNPPNFRYVPGYSKLLRFLSYLSLILTFVHVWRLAQIWSIVS